MSNYVSIAGCRVDATARDSGVAVESLGKDGGGLLSWRRAAGVVSRPLGQLSFSDVFG